MSDLSGATLYMAVASSTSSNMAPKKKFEPADLNS